jgi:tight adherence protein B
VSALDLALLAGLALVLGGVAYWRHRRRASARLARVSRAANRRSRARPRWSAWLVRRPVLAGTAAVALGSGGALALAGPVAAVLVGVYCLMATLAARRHLLRRDGERLVAGLLDAVDATAEGLRAGALPDGSTLNDLLAGAPSDGSVVGVARARLAAAYRLSESLGVPLVGLLERVDADLRSGQALRAEMAAQLSGAQTSTAVLLPLPLLGLWVGAAIGIDPVQQLLHTPLGAGCAASAVALQWLGLLWTGRMVRSVTAEAR